MSHAGDKSTTRSERRERPVFLPWNRRLRHLQGISVRNLSLSSATNSHQSAKTHTDEAVNYTVKSPAKLLAQNEAKSLHQTRSFTSLRSPGKEFSGKENHVRQGLSGVSEPSQDPRPGRLRRRSTLRWSGPNPETRQQRLEDIAQEKLAEAWYSLHVTGVPEPVYISEICEKSVNPNFGNFDLGPSGSRIGRANNVKMKLWIKTGKMEAFALLVDLQVAFASLQFIGKSLDHFHHPLPPNCILFHFEDGIYTSLTDTKSGDNGKASLSTLSVKTGSSKPENTSSYNALLQLANIDDCIQDALVTRSKLEEQINSLLSHNSAKLELLDQRRRSDDALSDTVRAISYEQRQIKVLGRKVKDLKRSIKARTQAVEDGRYAQTRNEAAQNDYHTASREARDRSTQMLDDSTGQIRRIGEDLLTVYPLEPIKTRALNFCIRNIYLPNSVFDDTNRDEIAAALGFTCRLTYMLSLYLCTPLPYPLSPASSVSTIEDPVSTGIAQRTFPLYPTNVAYKFEYGVFLLNKNIEILMDRNGLRVIDIRHTLPNLKYLLYVLTAGSGELPERRAGGIRGLLAIRSNPDTSRRGSDVSVSSSNTGFHTKPSEDQHAEGKPLNEEKSRQIVEANISGFSGRDRRYPSPAGATIHDGKNRRQAEYQNTSLREPSH